MITELHCWDCDGVLLDSSKRYRTIKEGNTERIDLEYWRAMEYTANETDYLLPHANIYRKQLVSKQVFTVIATARAMIPGDAQYSSMLALLGEPDKLIYRKPDDNRKGAELKLQGLRKLLNLKQFRNVTVIIWEDNAPQLAAMVAGVKSWGFNVIGQYVPSNQGH